MAGAANLIAGGSPGGNSGSLFASETEISSLPVGLDNRIRRYSKPALTTNTAITPTSTVFENRAIGAESPQSSLEF